MVARKPKRKNRLPRLIRWLGYVIIFLLVLQGLVYGIALLNKDKILEAINDKLKTVINGEVQIGQLNFTIFEKFPAFSISLSDIYIRGPRYSRYHHEFFSAGKIYIDIEPGQLIVGTISLQSIRIEDGNVFVFRTSDGYTNVDVFKKKDPADTAAKEGFKPTVDLKKISFKNTKCLYFDSIKRKSYGVNFYDADVIMNTTDSSRQLSIVGDLRFIGLMLKETKGSYLSDKSTQAKLNVEVIRGVQGLKILQSELQFEKSRVELSGQFHFAAPGSFILNIHSPNLDYKEGTTIVTRVLGEKLGKFNLTKPVDLTVKLDGSLGGGEPAVDMKFATRNNQFNSGKVQVRNFSFNGTFNNHLDPNKPFGDPNSRLVLEQFSGTLTGIPTEGKVEITDLKNPRLLLDTHGNLNLRQLNSLSDTTRVLFHSGTLNVAVLYDGFLKEYLDSTVTKYEGKLIGSLKVENASWSLPNHQKKFDKTEVALHFDNNLMSIEKINLQVNGNPVEVKGTVTGFIPFFLQPEKKGIVNLSIHSQRMNVAQLVKKKSKQAKKAAAGKGRRQISNLIDLLYDKVEFNIDLRVDDLVNDAFHASNIAGKIKMEKGKFSAGPVSMKTAGGAIVLTFQMNDLDKPENNVSLSAEVKDADIKTFFKSFHNFSQTAITADNISGKISSRVRLTGTVDDQFKLRMPTLRGRTEFRIKQGRLVNFAPMENMSNFLFKNRDFSVIDFAEIKGRLDFKGTTITIHRMEIESSVLFLFVEGIYSLKEDTDLSIQVPLRNLKKKDKKYKPQNVGVDAKVGPSVFLRGRKDKDGKLGFSYDPFKKLRKK